MCARLSLCAAAWRNVVRPALARRGWCGAVSLGPTNPAVSRVGASWPGGAPHRTINDADQEPDTANWSLCEAGLWPVPSHRAGRWSALGRRLRVQVDTPAHLAPDWDRQSSCVEASSRPARLFSAPNSPVPPAQRIDCVHRAECAR
uniref:Uncharacterized protein n=1 Tax=Plectus sambesii TaxID=2011161 RepID=A0A914V663_9BILA